MALPTEPGAYRDVRGDIWLLGEDGRWQHGARRRDGGELDVVMGRFTGRMTPAAFEHMAQGPGVEVLPLTRAEPGDAPA